MTAFLKTYSDHYGMNLGNVSLPLDVTDQANGDYHNVTIHLGGGHIIGGNRPEDFQTLKDACDKALAFFQKP